MEGLDAHDTDDPTKDIGLLEVDINEFGCPVFDVLDGLANVG